MQSICTTTWIESTTTPRKIATKLQKSILGMTVYCDRFEELGVDYQFLSVMFGGEIKAENP
jgi:hypothetical protein